jgi:hypothetical protein
MPKMNRRQLRALIQESMRIGYELDGPRSEFYDDGAPEDDEAGLRFMSPRGRAPMPYAVDDSQDAMDTDIDFYPSDDYEGLGRLMRSQGREMPHHHDDDYSDLGDLDIMGFEDDMLDDDMMMERNEIRKMIQAIMVETSKVVPAAAGAAAASGGIPGMGIGAIVAYLWATDQLGDVEAIAKDLMKKGTGVGQLWMRLDPEVQEAAIDLANAASNLPRAANEKIKNTTVEILEKATAALTMD